MPVLPEMAMMHANGKDGHPYKDSLVDALVAGGAAFFGTLSGMAVVGVVADGKAAVLAGAISFGVAFFASLRAAFNRLPGDKDGP